MSSGESTNDHGRLAGENSSSAAEVFARLHPCAIARLRHRILHPSDDEIALAMMRRILPASTRDEDVSIPSTAAAVLAVADRKRGKLEAAYGRLVDA